MAEALGMSLCHYVLALSLYVRGISVITPLPLGEGFGRGAISFLYRVLTIIL